MLDAQHLLEIIAAANRVILPPIIGGEPGHCDQQALERRVDIGATSQGAGVHDLLGPGKWSFLAHRARCGVSEEQIDEHRPGGGAGPRGLDHVLDHLGDIEGIDVMAIGERVA